MTEIYPKIGDSLLGGRYSFLSEAKGSIGRAHVFLGQKGICRFCGTHDPARFRKTAHTFPEALGNKWVFSRDECDDCNTEIFSLYDEELTKALSPFLTLGGVRGKNNKVRATGRTGGRSHIEQRDAGGRRQIFAAVLGEDAMDSAAVDPVTGRLRLTTPIAAVPFKPRFAYKALCKMAVALLPEDELANYTKLIAWLLDPYDSVDFPVLEVGISFASIGNAPPLATGQLLRRVNPTDIVPHIVSIFSAGSVCLQIDLLSDHMEDHLPPVPRGCVKIEYANVIGDEVGNPAVRIAYGAPRHLNWSSAQLEPQPIESMILDFDPETCEGRFTPIFRQSR